MCCAHAARTRKSRARDFVLEVTRSRRLIARDLHVTQRASHVWSYDTANSTLALDVRFVTLIARFHFRSARSTRSRRNSAAAQLIAHGHIFNKATFNALSPFVALMSVSTLLKKAVVELPWYVELLRAWGVRGLCEMRHETDNDQNNVRTVSLPQHHAEIRLLHDS